MKRNKMLTITSIIAALLLTIGAGVSIAKGGMHRPGKGPGLMRCIDKLNLSTDTKNAINTLVQKNRESKKQSWQSNRETMKTLFATYNKVLTASPLDSNALATAQNAIITQMQNQMQARMQSHFDLDQYIVKLLTPDELATLATCLESEAQHSNPTGTLGPA